MSAAISCFLVVRFYMGNWAKLKMMKAYPTLYQAVEETVNKGGLKVISHHSLFIQSKS